MQSTAREGRAAAMSVRGSPPELSGDPRAHPQEEQDDSGDETTPATTESECSEARMGKRRGRGGGG